MRTSFLLVAAYALASGSVRAGTIDVPGDAPDIQTAIAAAGPSDEILVGPGTWFGPCDFLGKAVVLRSTSGPGVTTLTVTPGGGSVVRCVSGEGPGTVLEGFTITGGSGDSAIFGVPVGGGLLNVESSPTVRGCIFTGNGASVGGAVFNAGSDATIEECSFISNVAVLGGAMHCFDPSTPRIIDCLFQGNIATGTAVGGGAVSNNSTTARYVGCTFIDNSALDDRGGAAFNVGGAPSFYRCRFESNDADGGGAVANQSSSAYVTSSLFIDNTALDLPGGGGVLNVSSGSTVFSCLFLENTAAVAHGGAVLNVSSGADVVNCTIVGNTAFGAGGGVGNSASNPTIANSIVLSNLSGGGAGWNEIGNVNDSHPVIRHSDVEGCNGSGFSWNGALGFDGTGNIDADPLFIDLVDFRIADGSPCIDAANNGQVPADFGDTDDDGDTDERMGFDLDGNPRFTDDPGRLDTGIGPAPVIDMGAYEFQLSCSAADFDSNGAVGFSDLSALLIAWGGCPPVGACPHDLNANGEVSFADLVALLLAWGDC